MNKQETKPLWKVAHDAYYAVEGYGECAWTAVIDTVIAEHERRKAARVKPEWKLPDPPEGEQWHRTDWTQDMLPDGYRPHLLGELDKAGDEQHYSDSNQWIAVSGKSHVVSGISHNRRRTTRPLPVKPDPVLVPLGSEDVPPGSVMRHKDQFSWLYRYVQPGYDWITFVDDGTHLSFQRAFDDFVINRNDGKGWQPCSKEVQP